MLHSILCIFLFSNNILIEQYSPHSFVYLSCYLITEVKKASVLSIIPNDPLLTSIFEQALSTVAKHLSVPYRSLCLSVSIQSSIPEVSYRVSFDPQLYSFYYFLFIVVLPK